MGCIYVLLVWAVKHGCAGGGGAPRASSRRSGGNGDVRTCAAGQAGGMAIAWRAKVAGGGGRGIGQTTES